MTSTDLEAQPPSRPAPQSTRSPRIPRKVREACDLLAEGQVRTITDAAKAVGLCREHLSRMLNKPHVQVFMGREARRTIARASMRAAHRAVELIGATSEHVSLDAAKHILAIEGIKPAADATQVSVSIDIKAGYVLDLRDDAHMGHEREASAKPLIEHASVRDEDTSRD